MNRATIHRGRRTIRLAAYRDTRGTQFEVIREQWNAARTNAARSVFMTDNRRAAFAALRAEAGR